MARNYIPLDAIVNDYILQSDEEDYGSGKNRKLITVYAKQGLRALNLASMDVIKSVRIPINKTLNVAELPNDYVDYTKIGILSADCKVYVLGKNDRLTMAGDYLLDHLGQKLLDSDGIELQGELVCDTSNVNTNDLLRNDYYFYNYVQNENVGRLYGLQAGNNVHGYYRIDTATNRILLDDVAGDYIVLEYLADESMAANPLVHAFAEEALKLYIYYMSIYRKSNVPASTKQLAKNDFDSAKRAARAQFLKITKEEGIAVFNKAVLPAPNIGESA